MNDITALAQGKSLRKKLNRRMNDALGFRRTSGGKHNTISLSIDECKSVIAALDERLALVEALEKAQQKIVEIQQGCENDPRIHEIIDLKEHVIETNYVLCNLLPDCRYMDPPDGGSVTPLEQVSRMVADYRQRIAELESEVKFPGVMRCNTCGFSRSHVIVTPGGMRAGESTPEHCPNGCGPMWHDTYRRQYNELYDAYKALESRTVTVMLPSLKQPESGERYMWSDGVFNYRSDAIGILRAAGIQVIEGEQKNG